MDSISGSKFTVQISSGGGQFLNFYSGSVDESRSLKLKMARSGVSDIRIIVDSGNIVINNIRID